MGKVSQNNKNKTYTTDYQTNTNIKKESYKLILSEICKILTMKTKFIFLRIK